MFDDFNRKTFSTSELQINNIIQIRKNSSETNKTRGRSCNVQQNMEACWKFEANKHPLFSLLDGTDIKIPARKKIKIQNMEVSYRMPEDDRSSHCSVNRV